MKISLIKNLNNTFSIAYNSDYDKCKKIKAGVIVECEIKKKRNYEFHKKYFALINMLFDNQEVYNNINYLREDLTIEAGFYTIRRNMNGDMIKEPNSVSFSSMDEIKFNHLYSKTLDAIVKHFNFNKQDIINNVEQYF